MAINIETDVLNYSNTDLEEHIKNSLTGTNDQKRTQAINAIRKLANLRGSSLGNEEAAHFQKFILVCQQEIEKEFIVRDIDKSIEAACKFANKNMMLYSVFTSVSNKDEFINKLFNKNGLVESISMQFANTLYTKNNRLFMDNLKNSFNSDNGVSRLQILKGLDATNNTNLLLPFINDLETSTKISTMIKYLITNNKNNELNWLLNNLNRETIYNLIPKLTDDEIVKYLSIASSDKAKTTIINALNNSNKTRLENILKRDDINPSIKSLQGSVRRTENQTKVTRKKEVDDVSKELKLNQSYLKSVKGAKKYVKKETKKNRRKQLIGSIEESILTPLSFMGWADRKKKCIQDQMDLLETETSTLESYRSGIDSNIELSQLQIEQLEEEKRNAKSRNRDQRGEDKKTERDTRASAKVLSASRKEQLKNRLNGTKTNNSSKIASIDNDLNKSSRNDYC